MTDFIYALSDPRDENIRYVGKTDNLTRRYKDHLNDKSHCHRVYWIQSLLELNLKPTLIILEAINSKWNWEDREIYWIRYFKDAGYDLVNMTDGGDRGPDMKGKSVPKSEQGRKNIIKALVERNKSPEMRETSRKHGLANKGRKLSPESIAKMREYMTGRKIHSDEFKRKLAERNKTRIYDPEIMRANSRRLWDDPEKGPKMRKALSERSKSRKGMPRKIKNRESFSKSCHKNSRKLWDDPEKSQKARQALIERNKARKGISRKIHK